jgi:formate hydrogenlyase subunit 3/multisubunit Na+/H+ antiporter MnhD subunit
MLLCFVHLLDLAILYYVFRFLTKGGVMILATWLSQAAVEEQTSVLLVILKVYTDFMRLI